MANREELIERMQRYLQCMLAHDVAALERTRDVKLTENGEPLAFGSAQHQRAQVSQFRQFFADPTTQQVGCFATLQTSPGAAMLALRLKYDAGALCEVEAIMPRPGGHVLFAPEALVEPLPIYEQLVESPPRAARQELLQIADRYFDAIEQANGRLAPFHPACNRRENGVQTSNNPPRFTLNCQDGIDRLTYIPRVRDRRSPIVDEERGLVWALVMFDMPTQNRSMRLAELFKISAGEIREIEALMINTPLGAVSGWET